MSQYTGRHAARSAAPWARRLRSGPGALSSAILAGALAATMALSPAPDSQQVDLSAGHAEVSPDDVSPDAMSPDAKSLPDAERLVAERAQPNVVSRGQVRAEIQADEAAGHLDQERASRQAAVEQDAAEQPQEAALRLEAAQADPQAAARVLMPEFGFTGETQWQCLEALWMGESDWRWWVENPSSGAYGIPQSLPADKMAAAGADWRTNPVTQIRWGLEYIKLSYGTPCGAWEFWQAQDPHWY